MSIANSQRRYRKLIMTALVGSAIALGAGVAGAAPAGAAPNTMGPNPNPFSTLGASPRETAPAGSPALKAEIDQGLREGFFARVPGLPAAK